MTLCACGCGQIVTQKKTGRPRRWLSDAHRMRAARQARDVRKPPEDGSVLSEHRGTGDASVTHVEVCNDRRTARGDTVDYTGPFPGFRTVAFLGLEEDGEKVRIRYLGPDPLEEVLPVTKLTGIVEDGRIDRDPARMRAFLEAGEGSG